MTLLRSFTVLFALVASTVHAVTPISIEGSQFVNPVSKKRFQIIGVDYQPGGAAGYKEKGGADPLSDGDICLRDAALLQRLGVNTIRIYNLNPATNHDLCVSIFNAAGIYLILDVNSPIAHQSLNRADPASTYHKGYMERVFGIVEAFKDYPNTLAFFGGNEVINEDAVKEVPAYIRAVQRDIKEYISKHAPRSIPVGYSAADIRNILADTWAYMSCQIDDSDISLSDFFGLNSYSWCGDASFTTSGYDKLVEQFAETSLPVFFSEYGCNKVQPRIFTEVGALYGKEMTKVMGGGLLYEYSQESNDFGLVQLHPNNTATILVDYDNLMDQYRKVDLSLLESLDPAATSIKPPKCSPDLIKDTKHFENDFKIPKAPEEVPEMIKNGIKNPNKGNLVEVKNTKVKFEVYNKDGVILENLSIKVLQDFQSNLPGEKTSGAPGAVKEKKKGAASTLSTSNALSILAAVVGLTLLMV
ncbi:hypothetical protein PABG_07614 [Paracoccidioides brasiliensis Pb03]|uniref:1,3-beta-glucanosyltransferase n=2 Tax=Paracoccidioides brasiliensis TaxID=121759 RepID=C1GBS5_PARBD|nr:uncharacterized protein PADG_05076 [Paracoccidioides brasiliensis Pb18]EEH18554.1 hypothetical protein PABG_07614 [Paracoccidioides brasiliensis Pb03]EEH48997.1 hypothetical protein PADG_05076 [Paracoccidioides brasiliensis Pb18]ODH13527.1 hypothetical protein ACO22_07170 [Paracoccidioides brasiliensis]ODH47517.1 hypothetical protein GX48_06376 [Paracoccidioides brasiliensis]